MATADLIRPRPAKPPRDPFPRPWSRAEFDRMRQMGLFDGRSVSLDDGTVMEHAAGGPRPLVFTRKEYSALGDAGFFRDQRVQLIGGVIVQESPMNPPHATAIQLAYDVLRAIFGTGYCVRVQLPLDLGLISEPHPDLAVVVGSPRDYAVDHPKTALLVVEVADTTLEEDTHDKASLYAAGGIADYWVIDVTGRLLVFRESRPEPAERFGFVYARVAAYGRDDHVSPLAAPTHRLNVADLLP
jgi:Uma2 family endonuclease